MSRQTAQIEAHSVWHREALSPEAYEILTCSETGLGEIPLTERSTTTVFGRNCDGNFEPVVTAQDPPGDLPEFQLDFYEMWNEIHPILKAYDSNVDLNMQRLRYSSANNMDVRALAKQIDYFKIRFSGGTRGAAPNVTGEGGAVLSNVTMSMLEALTVQMDLSIAAVTLSETENLLSGAMLSREIDRNSGYRGPDKVAYIGADTEATPTNPGNLLVTVNGGGVWAAMANAPFPDNRGVFGLGWQPITETSFRLFCLGGPLTAVAPAASYYDLQFGQENSATATPTAVAFPGAASAEGGTAMLWPSYSRLYAAVGTNLYISSDAGVTFPSSPAVAPGQVINKVFQDSEENVWIVTGSDGILIESKSNRGTFAPKVGPGGGDITAFARGNDGGIMVGAGKDVYRSDDEARGNWTLSLSLPASTVIKDIWMPKGFSEVAYVVANDTGPVGTLYRTVDGGVTWSPFTATVNTGYNGILQTSDANLMYLFGQAGKLELVS